MFWLEISSIDWNFGGAGGAAGTGGPGGAGVATGAAGPRNHRGYINISKRLKKILSVHITNTNDPTFPTDENISDSFIKAGISRKLDALNVCVSIVRQLCPFYWSKRINLDALTSHEISILIYLSLMSSHLPKTPAYNK